MTLPTVGLSPAAEATPPGWHPDVWALGATLKVCYCRLPNSTPEGRLLQGLASWVRLGGKHRPNRGEWWAGTLAMVETAAALIDEQGTRNLLAPWCNRRTGPGAVSRTGFVADGGGT